MNFIAQSSEQFSRMENAFVGVPKSVKDGIETIEEIQEGLIRITLRDTFDPVKPVMTYGRFHDINYYIGSKGEVEVVIRTIIDRTNRWRWEMKMKDKRSFVFENIHE